MHRAIGIATGRVTLTDGAFPSAYYNEQWKQEIEMIKRLKCESVVKALDLPDAFQTLKVDTPILAMEFCSGGDLRKVLNKPVRPQGPHSAPSLPGIDE